MDRRLIAVAGLACLVLLAGCTSVIGNAGETPGEDALATGSPAGGGATTPTTTADTAPSPTATSSTGGADGTATDATATDASTTDTTATPDRWRRPASPNGPLENRLNRSQGNRVFDVTRHDGSNATGGAVATRLTVTANTSMARIDPKSHGTVRGEPYFLVYVNGTLTDAGEWGGSQFHTVNGTLAARRDNLAQRDNGTFEMAISHGAYEAAGVEEGNVSVVVLLMDEDKQWDDVYGARQLSVRYEPPE